MPISVVRRSMLAIKPPPAAAIKARPKRRSSHFISNSFAERNPIQVNLSEWRRGVGSLAISRSSPPRPNGLVRVDRRRLFSAGRSSCSAADFAFLGEARLGGAGELFVAGLIVAAFFQKA